MDADMSDSLVGGQCSPRHTLEVHLGAVQATAAKAEYVNQRHWNPMTKQKKARGEAHTFDPLCREHPLIGELVVDSWHLDAREAGHLLSEEVGGGCLSAVVHLRKEAFAPLLDQASPVSAHLARHKHLSL